MLKKLTYFIYKNYKKNYEKLPEIAKEENWNYKYEKLIVNLSNKPKMLWINKL